jgi:hypothetical protein
MEILTLLAKTTIMLTTFCTHSKISKASTIFNGFSNLGDPKLASQFKSHSNIITRKPFSFLTNSKDSYTIKIAKDIEYKGNTLEVVF